MALLTCRQNQLSGAIALAVATLFVGCNATPLNVWVYIDNAGTKPLVVTVDGQATNIAPGEFAKLTYPPGEHKFRITSGDEVVCELTKNLEASNRIGVARKYLFNPDRQNRYQTFVAKYGASRLEGVMQTSLLRYQKDPQIKRQYIYKQLLKEIRLLPADAWNDVTGIDYVLTPPPEVVYTKGTTRRTVLARVQPQLYSRLEQMAKNEKPSDEDIDSLNGLIDEVLADAP
jgi:hypothetical protein